jgi:hypothetical protein
MARYRHYNDYAISQGLLMAECGFALFANRNVDDAVMGDYEVVEWANDQDIPIKIDDHFWSHPASRSKHGIDYPHAMVVDCWDSAILMIRDPDLAMAFKLKFC